MSLSTQQAPPDGVPHPSSASRSFDRKREAFERGERVPIREELEPAALGPTTVEEATLKVNLLRLAEKFARAEREAQMLLAAETANPSVRQLLPDLALMDWVRSYEEELRYIAAARNAIVHSQPIDEATLRKAWELAAKLDEALIFCD